MYLGVGQTKERTNVQQNVKKHNFPLSCSTVAIFVNKTILQAVHDATFL